MSKAAASDATVDVVVFRVAGYLFGVEASQVRGSRPAGGDLAGVRSAEALLGFPASSRVAARRVLTIKGDPEDWQLAVDAPLELRRLEAAAIHPLPDLVAARADLHQLRALALVEDGLISLVDLRAIENSRNLI